MLTADNRFLVFQSDRSGEDEIWRANRDGSNLKQLTKGEGNIQPTVTPDGKWIIYTHYKDGFPTLWKISISGGKAEQFSNDFASWAMISPDGKYVAARYGLFNIASGSQIAIFSINGGKSEKIIPVSRGILYNRLKWTPDGKSIVHKDNKEGLWRIDIASGEREKIELSDDFRVGHFTWSANGETFAYSGGEQVHEVVVLEDTN